MKKIIFTIFILTSILTFSEHNSPARADSMADHHKLMHPMLEKPTEEIMKKEEEFHSMMKEHMMKIEVELKKKNPNWKMLENMNDNMIKMSSEHNMEMMKIYHQVADENTNK